MSRNSTTATKSVTKSDAVTFDPNGHDTDLVAAYKAASDPKSRAAIRTQVKSNSKAAMRARDLDAALYWDNTSELLRVDAAPKADVTPAHVTLAQRIVNLRAAADLLANGDVLPDGMTDVDWDAFTLDGVDVDSDAANKLAGAKITRSVERNSIMDAIVRAFGDEPDAGATLKISEVSRKGATDSYKPSPGAIRATFGDSDTKGDFTLLPSDSQGNPWRVRYTPVS